jgi:hypothetical protein
MDTGINKYFAKFAIYELYNTQIYYIIIKIVIKRVNLLLIIFYNCCIY